MAVNNFKSQEISNTLKATVEDFLRTKGGLEFTKDTQIQEKEIIEFDSRMRTFGQEKFNGPCYLGAVNFYLSEGHKKQQDAHGVVVAYLEDEDAPKLLKALGYKGFSDEDEDQVLDATGKFAQELAEAFKGSLGKLGYNKLVLSEPHKFKNDAPEGVEFHFDEHNYFEASFFLWKHKALVVSISLHPPV